jgi:hypothetical protein
VLLSSLSPSLLHFLLTHSLIVISDGRIDAIS